MILLLSVLDRAGTNLSKQLDCQSTFCHFPEAHHQENLEYYVKFNFWFTFCDILYTNREVFRVA